jgi:hypothetical protein
VVTKILQAIFWLAAAAYAVAGVMTIASATKTAPGAESLGRVYIVFGVMLVSVGALAAIATLLAKQARKWLVGAAAVLGSGLLVALFAAFWIDMEKGEVNRRYREEEARSGRHAFGDQPALLAIAQAVAANDQAAIRSAATAVPDLQTPGRDGATLLAWAVGQTWQRPQLVEAVRTLLSVGADPNHTNGQPASFAMAKAVHGPAAGLAAMLDAGGNPNARDEHGRPIILMNWYLGYYKEQERARFELLLDRGADVNTTMPVEGYKSDGYPLLLHRLSDGPRDPRAYADVLLLLERGADASRAGADGMTFAKMLVQQRRQLASGRGTPPEFYGFGR